VVREGRRTGQLQIRLVTSRGELDRDGLAAAGGDAAGVLWTQIEGVGETTQGGQTELIAGEDRLEEELAGVRLRVSSEAFLQTNTEMAEQLYGAAIEYAELSGFERVYDLYCGIGTIGLAIAPRVAEVWGLEIVEEAIADAIANARLNEIHNARFFAGDVRLAMRELLSTAGRPDVLVLDPPRAGLAQRRPAGGGRVRADEGQAGGHVPADAAHRVRRAAGPAVGFRAAPCAPSRFETSS
jgi:23S rRNA (uracil1939-C5)-methyltransferase